MKFKGFFFTNSASLAIVGTVFSLWLSVYFEQIAEAYFGYIFILTVGILHGANDIKLIEKLQKGGKKSSFWRVLGFYILVVLLMAAGFFFLPKFALFLFIIISAYHFGEQHLSDKSEFNTYLKTIIYFAYGMTVFSLLFYLNPVETIEVIYDITGLTLERGLFRFAGFLSIGTTLLIGTYGLMKSKLNVNWLEEIFLLALLALVFEMASLIWAFAVYFIFWHSIPSLYDQVTILYGTSSKSNMLKYLKSSWLYWLISVVGLGFILYLFRNQDDTFMAIFFSFLAAITLPHVIVMNKVLDR